MSEVERAAKLLRFANEIPLEDRVAAAKLAAAAAAERIAELEQVDWSGVEGASR